MASKHQRADQPVVVGDKFKAMLHKGAGKDAIQVTAVMEKFIARVGGMDNFVEMLETEWKNAPKGGLIRQRILGSILDGFKFAERLNPVQEDLSLVTDADLDAEAEALMRQINGEFQSAGSTGIPQELPLPGAALTPTA